MNERELSKFEENVVKGASLAFQRLVKKRKEENGELVFARNGQIFRVKPLICKTNRLFDEKTSSISISKRLFIYHLYRLT